MRKKKKKNLTPLHCNLSGVYFMKPGGGDTLTCRSNPTSVTGNRMLPT